MNKENEKKYENVEHPACGKNEADGQQNTANFRGFLLLWFTQGLSQLGSSMTAFALTLWLYEKTGSSLNTAGLAICSYAPYVLMSILAGALTDRFDKKKIMLIADTAAAFCTAGVLLLHLASCLAPWHLYVVNAGLGLMNTVQQPASEVAMTLLTCKEQYQRASSLKSLSRSMVSILHPLLATALYGMAGLSVVIAIDLGSFAVAFLTLAFGIHLPKTGTEKKERIGVLVREGIGFLRRTPLVLTLILFLAGVNLVASAFDAALPGFVIPNPKGGTQMLGIVTSSAGIAMVVGSVLVSFLPEPKNRAKVIYYTMLFSLGTENFLLAFSREPVVWCIGQVIGWILVPVMSTNLEVVLRTSIPVELQGRVFACRNSLQFFTIPIGLFLGGFLVDDVCEPFMVAHTQSSLLCGLFGSGKGSGAALVMFLLGVAGIIICLYAGRKIKKNA